MVIFKVIFIGFVLQRVHLRRTPPISQTMTKSPHLKSDPPLTHTCKHTHTHIRTHQILFPSHKVCSRRYQSKIVWRLKKHQKYKIDGILSKNDGGTLKFYHDLYTNIVNVSSSLNFLNELIWWLQVLIYELSSNVSHHSQHVSIWYFSNIFL